MLALAAHAQPFNANLYVVAATIIPVYFVALMLPGSILPRYLNWAKSERSKTIRAMLARSAYKAARKEWGEREEARGASDPDDPAPDPVPFPRFGGIGQVYEFLAGPVYLVVLFGAYSEIQAVLALDHQAASVNEHQWVMDALIVMPIVLVAATWLWSIVDRQQARKAAFETD